MSDRHQDEKEVSTSKADRDESGSGFALEVGDPEKQATFRDYTDMLVRLYREKFVHPVQPKLDHPKQG